MHFEPIPHLIFEILAYGLGFRLYIYLKRHPERLPHSEMASTSNQLSVMAGGILGAALGAKLLAAGIPSPGGPLMSGKTIVGGLLGGLIGVEIAKKLSDIRHSTGDLFVFPLILGMCVGRVGCFLSGLNDNTHGIPTTLPWAWDYGDGIGRHPAQIYEILLLMLLGAFLLRLKNNPYRNGDLFKIFMIAYLSFRFLVDFIKPYPSFVFGINIIQWACLGGLVYYSRFVPRLLIQTTKRWRRILELQFYSEATVDSEGGRCLR
ncbi:MAG: prolipoprotein diacylglyceryl transferase family protein [Verrucomicrobiota bacterium]